MPVDFRASDDISPKSYGTAVALCLVFGIVGIHHFYMGNWLHGLIDLGLFLLAVVLFASGSSGAAMLVLIVDVVHTIYVTYLLIVGSARDGQGRLISYPGQY